MKISDYKRQDYKILPMDVLREICIYKQKQISYCSYALVILSAITLTFCGILGWATIFTSLYGSAKFMTPAYFFAIVYAIAFLFFGSGVKAESKFCTKTCIVFFVLLFLTGLYILFVHSNLGETLTSFAFMIVSVLGLFFYLKLPSCFSDMDELRKLDGFPRFIEYAISKVDFEKRVK